MGATRGAIIVAAGRSTRMSGTDKLFSPLAGKPVLAHALAPFQTSPLVDAIALVVAAENLEGAHRLVADSGFSKVVALCQGGPRRQDSVRAGLEALSASGGCQWVLVHDGARPLVTARLIEEALAAVQEVGAAVPAIPIDDTVKEADGQGHVLRTLDRSCLWAVQTPQAFRYDLLCRAHREVAVDVTDDAAMLEALGLPVKIFPGSPLNLKVTTPEDLRLVEALLLAARPAS